MIEIEPPVLTPYYGIVMWVMIVQAVIVVLVAAVALSMQGFLKKRREMHKKERTRLQKKLKEAVEKQAPFESLSLDKERFDVSNVLLAVMDMDKEANAHSSWSALRSHLQDTYVLPKARKLGRHLRWTSKLKAARCFANFPKSEDEDKILSFLNHKIPIIKYTAAYAAGSLGSPRAIDAILKEMNHSTRYMRHPFHEALKKGGDKVYHYLEKRLEKEKNPSTRVSCLEVLSEKMNSSIAHLLEHDLKSPHKNLKIAAIRALGHYKDRYSVGLLVPHLLDKEWEVRAITARSLGYLHAKEALSKLSKLLHDPIWWVRINAALALKRMGVEGKEHLKAQDPHKDPFAYEIARYVLALEED